MNKAYTLSLLLPTLALPCAADLFPNGDFEMGGTSWTEVGAGGTFVFSYPASGGSSMGGTPDGGFGIIDHTAADEGFGIWVGNEGAPLLLADLNLEAGKTYNFTQDMKILSGPNIGGFKIDYTNGGDDAGTSGEKYPTVIGDGTTWETYTFEIPIPSGVDGFKVVPLWGPNSSVAFDNIGFDPTPVLPPVDPPVIKPSSEPLLAKGTLVTWMPTNIDKVYQPQSSQDGTTWTNLGPAFPGTDTTTILDPNSAELYRVQEKDPAGEQTLINGDFEIASFDNPSCPENWICLAGIGQFAERTESDSFSGSASVRLAVSNAEDPGAKSVVLKQELTIADSTIIPGESYTFSLRAKQINYGIAYDQIYKLVWFGENGPIAGQDVGPIAYQGGTGNWDEISRSGVVAPAGAVRLLIEFSSATGAVDADNVGGEVLIEDVSLTLGGASVPTNLETTTEPGIGITMLAKSGVTYKAQQSEDLQTFEDLTGLFTGNGTAAGAGIPDGGPSHFFRIVEVVDVAN